METIRINLNQMKTQEEAIRVFAGVKGFPAYFSGNLDSLYEILTDWTSPLKIEIEIGGDLTPFAAMMGMLEDARQANANLLFVVIMRKGNA